MKKILFAATFTMLSIISSASYAQTEWQHHRWRAHDNQRLENQNRRINQGVKDGQISQSQAQQLKSNNTAIFNQEKSDALNGSHLTRQEQKQIRTEENNDSRAIHKLRH